VPRQPATLPTPGPLRAEALAPAVAAAPCAPPPMLLAAALSAGAEAQSATLLVQRLSEELATQQREHSAERARARARLASLEARAAASAEAAADKSKRQRGRSSITSGSNSSSSSSSSSSAVQAAAATAATEGAATREAALSGGVLPQRPPDGAAAGAVAGDGSVPASSAAEVKDLRTQLAKVNARTPRADACACCRRMHTLASRCTS